MVRIILGSQSKFRRRLLAEAGIAADLMAADIDEKAVTAGFADRSTADPSALTLAIARAKADALLSSLPADIDAVLITCDQVIAHAGRIREKPETEAECRAYMVSYATEPARTVSAVVVTHVRTRKQVEAVDVCVQHFLRVPDDVMTAVIAKGDIMQCAGGFMVDEPLLLPYVGPRVGTEQSIIGLPVHLLPDMIAAVQQP